LVFGRYLLLDYFMLACDHVNVFTSPVVGARSEGK